MSALRRTECSSRDDVARPHRAPAGGIEQRGAARLCATDAPSGDGRRGGNGLQTSTLTRKSIRSPVALRQACDPGPSQGSRRVKILVTAKRVEDPESKIKVKPDGSGIVQEGLKYKINPFDEIARRGGSPPGRQARRRGGGGEHRRQGGPGAAPPRPGHGRHQGGLGEPRGPAGSSVASRRCSRASSSARSRTSSSSASRPSTTTRTRPASTSPSGSAGARRPSPPRWSRWRASRRRPRRRPSRSPPTARALQVVREVDGGLATLDGQAAGDRHHRPPAQPPALRLAARAS